MKNFKIGMRLGLGFASVLALMALMTVVGVWRLNSIGDAAQTMTERTLAEERLASDWVLETTANSVRTIALAKTSEPALEKEYLAEINASTKQIQQIRQQLEKRVTTPKGKQLMQQIQAADATYLQARDAVLKLKAEYEYSDAQARVTTHLTPAVKAYVDSIGQLKAYQKQRIDQAAAEIDEHHRTGRLLLIALGALALVLGALCAWLISRSITRPLQQAVSVATTVAGGDLTLEIDAGGRDETGQLLHALKDMNASLAQVVGQVRSGTDAIATASAQIAAGNADLSSRTEQQASSLEETASSMEELTSTVKQNADNARQANQLAVSASS
ncbi:MAG: MCP four helix bundle domain-containing protein, partial [Burkholderiaceae bacterium]